MPFFDRQPVTSITGYSLIADTANGIADTANTVFASYLEPIGYDTFSSTCPTCHSFYHRYYGMSPSTTATATTPRPSGRSNSGSSGSGSGSHSYNKTAGTMNAHLTHGPCHACEAEKRRSHATDWILAVLTVLCPPAVAYIKTGKRDFWLNVLLTLFGWAPGMLHAWYLIILHPGVHHRHEQVWREDDPECYRPEAEQDHYLVGRRGHQNAAGADAGAGAGTGIGTPQLVSAAPVMAPMASSGSGSATGGGNGTLDAARVAGHWRDSKDTPPSYAASSS